MLEFAYGELGLTTGELAELTPFEFELKVSGYLNKLDKLENNYRKLAWINFALNTDPKSSKGMTVDDIWPTRHTKDKPKKKALFSKAQIKKMIDKHQQLKNKRNGI